MKRIVILFSGGLDSYIGAYKLLSKGYKVYPITFEYGQRNTSEVEIARRNVETLGLEELKVVKLSFPDNGESLLEHGADVTKHDENAQEWWKYELPHRNTIFILYAFYYAQRVEATEIALSVSFEPNSYDDSTEDYLEKLNDLMNLGAEYFIEFNYPIAYMDKTKLFLYAKEQGILQEAIENTVTCVNNPKEYKNFSYGNGCGYCPMCTLRKQRYEDFLKL